MKSEDRFPKEYLTVLAHFYRGEVNRSTIWRQRMDATTNWAILATTASFSWVFTAESVESHFVFPFTTVLVLLLLGVEARRYRYYDVWRTRVRMLEVHLMVPALNPEVDILEGDWRTVLSNDLLLPTFKISGWEALGRRLYRNYVWLFIILFVGWFLRVYSGAGHDLDADHPQHTVTLMDFYKACKYRIIPPWVAIGWMGLMNLFIFGLLAVTWRKRAITGEIRRKDPYAKKWPI